MFLSAFCSEDESEDEGPLSKKAEGVQTQDAILPKEKPVIIIPESPKKKRPFEDPKSTTSKKQNMLRKSETVVLELADPADVDDIHLESSNNVRFPPSRDVRFSSFPYFSILLLEAPKPFWAWVILVFAHSFSLFQRSP